MTSILLESNPACLEYEMSRLDTAIEKVQAIIERCPSESAKAFDYYTTMQECLIALSFAMREAKNMQALYRGLQNRIILIEDILAKKSKDAKMGE